MYVTDSVDEYDDEPLSTEMLEDICDSSQYHPIINSREARYKIHDHIKRSQLEYKGDLLYTQNMGKGLHKLFKSVVNEMLQVFQFLVNLDQRFPISFRIPETFMK